MRVILCLLLVVMGAPEAARALDPYAVPHVSDRVRKDIAKDYDRSGAKGRYMLAVSTNGYWSATASERGEDGDLIRGALQKCEHIAGQRCGLAAMNGGNVDFREYPPQIRYVRDFDLNSVPFIWKAGRERLEKDYVGADGHKALTLSRNGGYGFSRRAESADAAVEEAMGYCTKGGERACFVYSVDGRVVFDKDRDIFSQQTDKNW